MKNYKRLYSLDYLRGLAALGIMVYHLTSWEINKVAPLSLLGIMGVYGVSIFYVLSGLTLYHVYFEKMQPDFGDLREFFAKRFFRIYPLLWLVIILTLVLNNIKPSLAGLVLNFTGLFGLLKWNGYYATGTWSIGNELVFYLFFPVFIFLSKKHKIGFYLLSALLLGCFLYFAFIRLKMDITLDKEWIDYVNPLNQVMLFLGGYLIGHWSRKMNLSNKWVLAMLLASTLILIFYPVRGVNTAAGINRIVFSLVCFLICFSLYKNTFRLPAVLDKPFVILGECSYGVYLLHPILWLALKKYVFTSEHPLIQLSPIARIITIMTLTIVIAFFVYHYFERNFMKLSKYFSSKPRKVENRPTLSVEEYNR